MIFDEATSALDTFTENEILKDINLLKNKTIIMISHRMNTLKYCDKIYLMDKGEIMILDLMTNLMKNTEKIIATTPLELSKFLGKKN